MTAPIVLFQLTEDARPGLLGEVLASRRRPVHVVEVHSRAQIPRDPAALRAVAVLPGPTESAVPGVRDLVRACAHAGVPVLGLGDSAVIVADEAGIGRADVRHEPALARVRTTPDAGDDPLAGAMPDNALWFTDVSASWEVDAGATVLARDADGTPVLLACDRTYAVTLRPDLGGDEIAALLGEDAVASRNRPFLRAYGAALIGRWVDLVVGRTEAEQPWGRRGPPPVPRPGVVLNPSDGSGRG